MLLIDFCFLYSSSSNRFVIGSVVVVVYNLEFVTIDTNINQFYIYNLAYVFVFGKMGFWIIYSFWIIYYFLHYIILNFYFSIISTFWQIPDIRKMFKYTNTSIFTSIFCLINYFFQISALIYYLLFFRCSAYKIIVISAIRFNFIIFNINNSIS